MHYVTLTFPDLNTMTKYVTAAQPDYRAHLPYPSISGYFSDAQIDLAIKSYRAVVQG
jgi:hypothetical protein